MNRKMLVLISLLVVFFFSSPAIAAQENVWVSARQAKLKAKRTVSSPTIVELSIGTRLTVHALKNRWYQVSTPDGRKGWIYRGKVSNSPPEVREGEKNPLGTLISDLTGSDIQADAADTSRSVRGLSPEAEAYAQRAGTPAENKAALDGVLAIQTTDKEIEQFLRSGKIGEYAE